MGSFYANHIMDRFGRKDALRLSSGAFIVGAGLMAIAPSFAILVIGRYALLPL